MKIILFLFLIIGFSATGQRESKFESSLWFVSDGSLDISDLNYHLYTGDSLISRIKDDTLTVYQERPQKYERRVKYNQLTLIVTHLVEIPIILTNIEMNKGKITWVNIAKLHEIAREKGRLTDLDLVVIDYKKIKPDVERVK